MLIEVTATSIPASSRNDSALARDQGGGAIPPTDLPSGIGNYCIYQSLIFSIGSPICVGKTSFVCAPTTDKMGFNQRGYWTARAK